MSSNTLYDGQCIDLTDDTDLTNNDKILFLDKKKPVNASPNVAGQTNNKTVPVKAPPSTGINNPNKNNNVIVLSNRVISPEKIKQRDGIVHIRPKGPTFTETNVEKGDIVLIPSPREIRSKKFPVEPPAVNGHTDDDVIFLTSESQPKQSPTSTPSLVSQAAPTSKLQQRLTQAKAVSQPTSATSPKPDPNLTVINGLSFGNLERQAQVKPLGATNKLPEVASAQGQKRTGNTISSLPPKAQAQYVHTTKTKSFQMATTSKLQTVTRTSLPQKLVQTANAGPSRVKSAQNVVQSPKVSTPPSANRAQQRTPSGKTVFRTLASYKGLSQLPKKILPGSPTLPVLPTLEKLGITGKLEGLSREEVLKAVRATSASTKLAPVARNMKVMNSVNKETPGKTYVRTKQKRPFVNPFSMARIEKVATSENEKPVNSYSGAKNKKVVTSGNENPMNPFSVARNEEVLTIKDETPVSVASEEMVSEESQNEVTYQETVAATDEDSSLGQIVIQNVYTANEASSPSRLQATHDSSDVASSETIPLPALVPIAGTPPAKPKNAQSSQARLVRPKPSNVLIDPIRRSVVYNKAIQKHIQQNSSLNLSDFAETVTAVSAITPDSDGNTDASNKGNVVFLLYPLQGHSGTKATPVEEGQVQQVLALVPSDSQLAPPAPLSSTNESKKGDCDLMPPPQIPLRRTPKGDNSTPAASRTVALQQRTGQPQSKDQGVQNAPPTGHTPPKKNTSKSTYEAPSLQEILAFLDSPKKAERAHLTKESPPRRASRRKSPVRQTQLDDVEIEPPAVVTPVDIFQIINRGKKREIKGRCQCYEAPQERSLFLGFTRREKRASSCLGEIKAIVRKERAKLRKMKKKMAEQDQSNIVYCGSATSYFLPETVKTEVEDDDVRHEIEYGSFNFSNEAQSSFEETELLPTITEVVSKVNEEVLHMRQAKKKAAPTNLSKTEEALQLIMKGLQMIKSWSQDNGSVEEWSEGEGAKRPEVGDRGKKGEVERGGKRRRQTAKESDEEPAQKRGWKQSEKEKLRGKDVSGKNAVQKRRGRKKESDDEDDLLVVKRVDIIKNATVAKKRGRRKKM